MSKPAPLNITICQVVPAPPATVYGLISDITTMSRYSPETVATSWLDSAGPHVGARFKGTNVIGKLRWSTNRPHSRRPRRPFRLSGSRPVGAVVDLPFEPVQGGTVVTESMSKPRRHLH